MYYQNNPDYDVLMDEARCLLYRIEEEITEYDNDTSGTITDDDCKRLLEQKDLTVKFITMLESIQ